MDIFGHLKTITRHKNLVMKYCFKCGIPFRGLLHDLSKYSPEEFIPGAKYYEKGKRSPNAHQREVMGYSSAWMHHKGRNKHHFEYWFDINLESGKYEPVKIPIKYLKESFCDRVAASKIYKGEKYKDSDPLDYFLTHGDEEMMHPSSSNILCGWLRMLAEDGERSTFKYLRNFDNEKY
ncbi:MAG: catalase [Ruminococcaceae bacterium]|nr:catalase [Oscillospiraceae bacterium]